MYIFEYAGKVREVYFLLFSFKNLVLTSFLIIFAAISRRETWKFLMGKGFSTHTFSRHLKFLFKTTTTMKRLLFLIAVTMLTVMDGMAYSSTDPIMFEDSLVRAICLQNWDANHDSVFTYAEAAAVKSLGTVFKKTEIKEFQELQYFTGLTEIEAWAFYECSNLHSITIPSKVTIVGDSAFYNNTRMTNAKLPDTFERVGRAAFCRAKIGCYAYLYNCKYIAEEAFYSANLWGVQLPDSMTHLGSYAFSGNSLTYVSMPAYIGSYGNYCFSTNKINSFSTRGMTIVPYGWFSSNKFTVLNIPDIITTLGDYAFSSNKLTTIYLGPNVTKIGTEVLGDISNIKNLYISDDNENFVTYDKYLLSKDSTVLYMYMPQKNPHDEGLILPYKVKEIKTGAFKGAKKLESVVLPPTLENLETRAFYNVTVNQLTIPASVTTIGYNNFKKPKVIYYLGSESKVLRWMTDKNTSVYVKTEYVNNFSDLTCKEVTDQIPVVLHNKMATLCHDFDIDFTDSKATPYLALGYNMDKGSVSVTPFPDKYVPAWVGDNRDEFYGVLVQTTVADTVAYYKIGTRPTDFEDEWGSDEEEIEWDDDEEIESSGGIFVGCPMDTWVEEHVMVSAMMEGDWDLNSILGQLGMTQEELDSLREYMPDEVWDDFITKLQDVSLKNHLMVNGHFKPMTEDGIVKGNHAYMTLVELPEEWEESKRWHGDMPTAIKTMRQRIKGQGVTEIPVKDLPLYNLQGQKVDNHYKGVVIQKGKKIINQGK